MEKGLRLLFVISSSSHFDKTNFEQYLIKVSIHGLVLLTGCEISTHFIYVQYSVGHFFSSKLYGKLFFLLENFFFSMVMFNGESGFVKVGFLKS